jgi:glutathione synthase/RimK-type ligase-like ATP-grasp enzyme
MQKVHKVLLLIGEKDNPEDNPVLYDNFGKLLADMRGYADKSLQFEACKLAELTMTLIDGIAEIKNIGQGFDIKDFDLVVFRTVNKHLEEALAVLYYCEQHDIKYIDSCIKNAKTTTDKLSEAFALWRDGIRMPDMVYGAEIWKQVARISFPAILKGINSARGKDNYLVNSANEIRKIIAESPDTRFILQPFIENDGDYRVLVLDYKIPVITYRQRIGSTTHVNNVSAGGTETLIEDATGLQEVVDISIRAAKCLGLEVAGVDIMLEKNTGKPFILEVNKAPQMTLEAEVKGYFDGISNILEGEG